MNYIIIRHRHGPLTLPGRKLHSVGYRAMLCMAVNKNHIMLTKEKPLPCFALQYSHARCDVCQGGACGLHNREVCGFCANRSCQGLLTAKTAGSCQVGSSGDPTVLAGPLRALAVQYIPEAPSDSATQGTHIRGW